jgi:hypothetical protein
MLDQEAPLPGSGWGCVVCDLPPNGAMVVLCDECLRDNALPHFVVYGPIGHKQRMPIDELKRVPFVHDLSRHPNERWERELNE